MTVFRLASGPGAGLRSSAAPVRARAAAVIGALCLVLALCLPAAAQEAADRPTLAVDFAETEAIPGQALSLRLTVLVPTFLPSPPVWPTFETPNLLVRVASTGPTSKSVGGATWAGITRRYLISPMVPGTVTLPPAEVVVTYADPDTNDPRTVRLQTEPLTLAGVVPEGAEGLDPFIAADALDLVQTLAGTPAAMTPGDSVIRTVTAQIRGTSPMFLPPLISPATLKGVRVYADQPVVEETSERGVVRGSRTERVTLLAEGGGTGTAPEITLDWYNLRTHKVETARADGFAVAVDGPPAVRAAPRDWRAIILGAVLSLLVLALAAWALRRLLPPLRRLIEARRAARLASEAHAFAVLERVVRRRDHAGLYPALDSWAVRVAGPPDPRQAPDVAAALAAIGAARYGPRGADAEADGWQRLAVALTEARRAGRAPHGHAAALPPLNPGAA